MGALTAPCSRLCFSVICHWRTIGEVAGSVVACSVRLSAVDLQAVLLAFWLQFGCALAEFSVQSCKVEPYTWVPGIFFFWPVVFLELYFNLLRTRDRTTISRWGVKARATVSFELNRIICA